VTVLDPFAGGGGEPPPAVARLLGAA
jgi:hypothetical protein